MERKLYRETGTDKGSTETRWEMKERGKRDDERRESKGNRNHAWEQRHLEEESTAPLSPLLP